MNVAVIDRQEAARVDRRCVEALVRRFMDHVMARPPHLPWDTVSVVLTDDAGIHAVNRDFLGHDYPTDVISFAFAPLPGADSGMTGEIAVNVERAVRLGGRHGSAARELALYVAHGCDHLDGSDDATARDRRRMRARECRWLRAPAARALVASLLRPRPPRSRRRRHP